MPFQKRDGLVIWLHNLKYLRVLRRYGYVHYVSKKMKYAILYCNSETADSVISQLSRMKFVKSIEHSQLQELRTTYENGKTKREERDQIYNC
ncbi:MULTISPECIES: YlbG family protein [unclassified Sporolactobacillus]|uniref:YlbG family protein n=1 Tax=unclassified Sporolactobacillus TaxID=2628533 RepID=UPI002367EFF6|nr:YlbG family protein [Sporolactobacillus sp. CQH2019]MDD9147174.1 YlbG family protein [Sporolactobacillus sp. CQH2019]